MLPAITATELRQYMICPCALYLDHHGPQEEREESHAFVEHLRELGRQHEQAVVATLPHIAVSAGSPQFRAQVTLHLLHEGHERIYQPVLADGDLVGIPDFLERADTPSNLGSFSYHPVDVKISTSPKPEQVAQLTFYALLLGRLQGLAPDTGDVILIDHSRETVELRERMGRVEQIVADVREVMAGRPESPALSAECGMCPWHDHCLKTLYTVGDVSLLDGLGPAKKAVLLEAGYRDLSAVADASADLLCELKGIGATTAARMILQAATLLERRPRVISRPRLPDAKIELHFDMECQQQTQTIYLVGVLQCERGHDDEFVAFVAERPEDEGEMWGRLLEYLRGLPSDPAIYHYHTFEATHLRRLADRHGIDADSEVSVNGGAIGRRLAA